MSSIQVATTRHRYRKQISIQISCLICLTTSWVVIPATILVALPPPEEIPEEVLRTEIITEARSPVDGKPLSAAEYLEIQDRLQTNPHPEALLAPKIKRDVFLLR